MSDGERVEERERGRGRGERGIERDRERFIKHTYTGQTLDWIKTTETRD